MKTLAFVGVDPGQNGAACLLGVRDGPDGAQHGVVVYCAVWDHVLRKTDRGEHVDPVHFASLVRHHTIQSGAVAPNNAHRLGTLVIVERVVIERPSVGGRMFKADGVITQGANYGIVLAASLCAADFCADVVEDADPAGGQWYAEAGAACPKGSDRKEHSVAAAQALVAQWTAAGARVDLPREGIVLARNDRADAVLLAYLGVLRWLGHTIAPATTNTAVIAKARTKSARDHEIARAMEGVDRSTLRPISIACLKCSVRSGAPCCRGSIQAPCRERVWAAAAGAKSPGLLSQSSDLAKFLASMDGAITGSVIACLQGVWRRVLADGTRDARVSRAALDAAIDAGLVRLTLDAKCRPVWVTTFRDASAPAVAVQPDAPC